MATTVTNIKSAYERLKRDISDVPNTTFIEWCDYMNKTAYRFMIGIDPERWISTQNYTVSDSPETEALPSDFKTIQPKGCGVFYIDSNSEPTEDRLPQTGYGSTYRGYYITGTNIIFTGIESSDTFTMRYIPTLDTIDELTDTVVIPDEYLEYMVKAVDVLYTQWDDDPSAEGFADMRFIRVMDELARDLRKEPSSYSLPDFSQSY